MKYLLSVFSLFVTITTQASMEYKVSAVDDLLREYNFFKAIQNEYKFEVKSNINGPYESISVLGQSNLCTTNFPSMNRQDFEKVFSFNAATGKANLKNNFNFDVKNAYSSISHFGSECHQGHYEDDSSADSNGPQQIYVCDVATPPKTTMVYLSIHFKVPQNVSPYIEELFIYCTKSVPYTTSPDLTIFEIEADVPKMGIKLHN